MKGKHQGGVANRLRDDLEAAQKAHRAEVADLRRQLREATNLASLVPGLRERVVELTSERDEVTSPIIDSLRSEIASVRSRYEQRFEDIVDVLIDANDAIDLRFSESQWVRLRTAFGAEPFAKWTRACLGRDANRTYRRNQIHDSPGKVSETLKRNRPNRKADADG